MRARFRQFMAGRSGMDKLNSLLFTLALIFAAVGAVMELVLRWRGAPWLTAIVFLAFGLFRFFSRNIERRRLENLAFLQLWSRVEVWWSRIWIRYRSGKHFKVLSCPNCKQRQRVPRGKGHVRITCKRCSARFDART